MNSVNSHNISIVIPSAGAPDVFVESLQSIFQGNIQPKEVIIVDDAMDEVATAIVQDFSLNHPIRILSNRGQGVSAARNAGARAAVGDIILFMDTDVVLRSGALNVIQEAFRDPEVHGIVGVQSEALRFGNFFSRWKNHWMRFTYQLLEGDIQLFYTSCAAIRRDAFLRSGGFDETYRLPSIEDTVFGAELGRQGFKIRPEPDFQIEHVKSYTLSTVLRTDRKRSAALVKFTLRNLLSGKNAGTSETSVPSSFIVGSLAIYFAWAFLLLAILPCQVFCWTGFTISLVALWILNASWLAYLLNEEGIFYFIKAFLFLPLDVTWVNVGIVQGLVEFVSGNRY